MLLINKGFLNKQNHREGNSSLTNFELEILLSKRPREGWTNVGSLMSKSKTHQNIAETDVEQNEINSSKMMLDFKMKVQPDLFVRGQEVSKFLYFIYQGLISFCNHKKSSKISKCFFYFFVK